MKYRYPVTLAIFSDKANAYIPDFRLKIMNAPKSNIMDIIETQLRKRIIERLNTGEELPQPSKLSNITKHSCKGKTRTNFVVIEI